jgi:hypothetical protein
MLKSLAMSTSSWVRWVAPVALPGCVWLVSCGGTSSSGSSPGDASVDGATDGNAGGEAGEEDGPPGDGSSNETSTTMEAGDGGCTGTGMTCRTCCRTTYTKGYDKLVTLELTCACGATVCGPLDSGIEEDAGAADASVLGTGACTTTCASKMTPDATCDKCLTQATGTMANPGVCYTDVATACMKDTDCTAYATCAMGCAQ